MLKKIFPKSFLFMAALVTVLILPVNDIAHADDKLYKSHYECVSAHPNNDPAECVKKFALLEKPDLNTPKEGDLFATPKECNAEVRRLRGGKGTAQQYTCAGYSELVDNEGTSASPKELYRGHWLCRQGMTKDQKKGGFNLRHVI